MLRGEGLLAWTRRPEAAAAPLPPGLRPLKGPTAVMAMSYDDTPVGTYRELSVAVPARLGLRPVLCTVAMVVSSAKARLECRERWGLPAELGDLRWWASADERELVWDDGGLLLRGEGHGRAVGMVAPLRWVQWRPGGPVVLPRRLWARTRRARCWVDVETGHDLAWAAGPHPGLAIQGARVVAGAARRPAGLLSSVPWRERVTVPSPEPAGGAATMASPRAYGSGG